jgi:Lamin Tail Domain
MSGHPPHTPLLATLLFALAHPPNTPAQTPAPTKPTTALHPIITEILFAVPTDDGSGRGDANHDGHREVAGDEFIEIANPHDQPIQLQGYTLRDSAPPGPTRFEFVFPPLLLEPGQSAVVFNGRGARWDGPVGDTTRAPQSAHPLFHNAHIFTARCSARVTFANAGDWVLLTAPSGDKIQCISWGSPRTPVPHDVAKIEDAGRVTAASIQRDADTGTLTKHTNLDTRPYSPGEAFITKVEPPPPPTEPPAQAGGSPPTEPPR